MSVLREVNPVKCVCVAASFITLPVIQTQLSRRVMKGRFRRSGETELRSRLRLKCDGTWRRTGAGGGGKGRGNKRMGCVTSRRHMTAEHRLARAVQTLQAEAMATLEPEPTEHNTTVWTDSR
jgi:hypothetical protein